MRWYRVTFSAQSIGLDKTVEIQAHDAGDAMTCAAAKLAGKEIKGKRPPEDMAADVDCIDPPAWAGASADALGKMRAAMKVGGG